METSDRQPLVATLHRLLQALGVPVTRPTIRHTLEAHPDFPSLSCLSDALHEWGVENMAVRLTPLHLAEVSFPFLAGLEEDGQDAYVVMEGAGNGTVTYTHPRRGAVTEPVDDFVRRWQGVALLVEANETSGEIHYQARRGAERRAALRKAVLAAAVLLLFGLALAQAGTWAQAALLLCYATGLVLSLALWSEETNQGAFTGLQKLCGVGKTTNCRRVIDSPAGKLFGWLSMADIGLVYFAGSLVAIATAGGAALAILALLSLAALPYTGFSVYFQARVVRTWCPLCLLTQAVLWLAVAVHLAGGHLAAGPLTLAGAAAPGAAFAAAALAWLFLKPYLGLPPQLRQLRGELGHFKRNESVFGLLLSQRPGVQTGRLAGELVLGDPAAPLTVTVVSNPFCAPCADTHQHLEKLLRLYDGDVKVYLRFTGDSQHPGAEVNRVARHLISLGGQPELAAALHDWYRHRDYERLKARYPANGAVDAAALHREHLHWCDWVQVAYTPALFVEGQLLPEAFQAPDLLVHLGHLVAQYKSTSSLPA